MLLFFAIIYFIGGFIIIPMSSVQIAQYIEINNFPKGTLYFDETSEYRQTDFKWPRVKVFTYGSLFSTPHIKNNYTVLYPPDKSGITKKTTWDIDEWIKKMKRDGQSNGYLNPDEDGYSYTKNLPITYWVAGFVIFSVGYLILIFIGIYKYLIHNRMKQYDSINNGNNI